MSKYPVVCICGSMRFFERMLETAARLTAEGFIVLMPFSLKSNVSPNIAAMLDDMHKRKMDMSSHIWIVTDESGYIGDSTRSEINYARAHDIPITFANWK